MKDEKTRIYLLRHGETANTKGEFRYNGHFDVDLTEEGERQLSLQAKKIKNRPLARIYSSGLVRSVKGAGAIAEEVVADVRHDERLKEIAAGRWEGLTMKEVLERFPHEFERRFEDIVNYRVHDGGENLIDVRNRALSALAEIVERHKGKEVAIVGHGGTNRIILCEAMGLELKNLLRIEQDFGCMNIIDYYDGTSVVKLLNQRP
ncbi:MAG: histidine phosphatase family protein [Deltaproteobacteria bacterium]|nr:histidine phosphatase family protein [Deltaproteobacteria bacterium]